LTAIVFGASGQDGVYLRRLLKEAGVDFVGVSRSAATDGGADGIIRGDVADFATVEQLVREHRPQYVFHLAATSTTRHDATLENHATIATGTINILEAAKRHVPCARVFLTGSGLQFRNNGAPISERDPFDAATGYAASRIASAYAARYYRSLGLKAYVGFLFHHESPLRKPHHVSQMVAQAARRIAGGSGEALEVGDLAVRKEWTFAGDVARGILTLVRQDAVFEAVIGSGITYSIEEWLAACFGWLGLRWQDHVRLREGFRAEYSCLVSDPSTMLSLGWRPEVSLPRLAQMMVSAPRDAVGEDDR
jgi:GDPmannose 4,6-dehydratase